MVLRDSGETLQHIADLLFRDHTSIIYHVNKGRRLSAENPHFAALLLAVHMDVLESGQ